MTRMAQAISALTVALTMLGCSTHSQSPRADVSRTVPITDVRSLAGQWGGLVEGRAGAREDYVELRIADDARYSLRTHRQIGTAADEGTLVLDQGRAVMQSARNAAQSPDRRTGVLQLLQDPSGRRALRLDGQIDPLRPITVMLTPTTR